MGFRSWRTILENCSRNWDSFIPWTVREASWPQLMIRQLFKIFRNFIFHLNLFSSILGHESALNGFANEFELTERK